MIGIIGGSSLRALTNLDNPKRSVIRTPFGIPSAPLITGKINGHDVVFLARHGLQHTIPPHIINYRANIWALHHVGCREVFAFSAMCSIVDDLALKHVVIPDQLIDYTWNRASTFFDTQNDSIKYTEFSEPYAASSREKLIKTTQQQQQLKYADSATYGITQGPRYETRAEIQRYRNNGCHLLGMTGMPEAALAQEIGIDYAVCGLITKQIKESGEILRLPDDISQHDKSDKTFSVFLQHLFV